MKNNDVNIPTYKLVFDAESGKYHADYAYAKQKFNGKFIRGPIPYRWLQAANSFPGKIGAVGVALWFLCGLKNSNTFLVTAQIQELAGCTRQALSRALKQLHTAKLIELRHRPGARAIVTILGID